MSARNRKNREKPVLRNLIRSQYIDQRNLLITERNLLITELKFDQNMLREMVDEINENIQVLNRIIPNRNVPYMRIVSTDDANNLDKTRAFLRSESVDHQSLENIKNQMTISEQNTFLVELCVNSNGYVEIGYSSDDDLDCAGISNFLLVDRDYLDCALIDIFLDSALFNSYSFLKSLSYQEKRKFNKIKVDFLSNHFGDFTKLDSPFYEFNDVQYQYLSIAFFARSSEDKVDFDELIDLWESFIRKYYPGLQHSEPSVMEQLQALTDIDQYPNTIIEECTHQPPGGHWLLRVHKKPSETKIPWIEATFGSAELGKTKIIQFKQIAPIYELVRAQDITAFKFVVM